MCKVSIFQFGLVRASSHDGSPVCPSSHDGSPVCPSSHDTTEAPFIVTRHDGSPVHRHTTEAPFIVTRRKPRLSIVTRHDGSPVCPSSHDTTEAPFVHRHTTRRKPRLSIVTRHDGSPVHRHTTRRKPRSSSYDTTEAPFIVTRHDGSPVHRHTTEARRAMANIEAAHLWFSSMYRWCPASLLCVAVLPCRFRSCPSMVSLSLAVHPVVV